jgi:hypothetical protein
LSSACFALNENLCQAFAPTARTFQPNLQDLTQPMPSDPSAPLTREERLAAKLRENLRRRKTQARALSAEEAAQQNNASRNEESEKGA